MNLRPCPAQTLSQAVELKEIRALCPKLTAAQAKRVHAILNSCPDAGEGVNDWLFKAARPLHPFCIEWGVIEELLEAATAGCGRALKPDEIPRAVRNSAPGRRAQYAASPKWPVKNHEQIEAVAHGSGFRAVDLERLSPAPLEQNPDYYLDALFPGNPLLCIGRSKFSFSTRWREDWRGKLKGCQFIVPSAMCKPVGRTQEGGASEHCLDNTGARQFLVVEFDFKEFTDDGRETADALLLRRLASEGISPIDLNASLHRHLASFCPIALAVHSGGKSLHGWYPCAGASEDALQKFFRCAVALGADRATWTRSQFVRLPGGLRDNGKPQRVLYFNAAVIPGGAQ